MENSLLMQGLRAAFIFCLYFLTLACYLAPVLITKYWGSKTQLISSPSRAMKNKQFFYRLISWCNCTATGIFLAMCFLGLLPNVQELFHSILKNAGYDTKFPLTECIIVLGFILTLLLEQSILNWQEQKESCLQEDMEQNQGLLEECEMQDLSDDTSGLRDDHEQRLVEELQHKSFHESGENDSNVDVISMSNNIDHDHGHNHFKILLHREKGFPFFILALATGLHSIFEGVTLGLQTNVTKAVHLFVAIIIHECLVAAALGINSTRLKYSFLSYFKFAIVFSAAIPAGVIIGILIGHAPGTAGEVASAVLQGLSAGIFLHVTFQDFLPSEFSNRQDRILKVSFLIIGFTIIASVTYFIH
ncbi:zinc transporter ZIP3-like [Uloborus diversus]|uniref:zinc transporter ZIP3-like n=1 Tax=Uloborus diversus TaxID=327109 RepID=UPI00240A8C47|nr:zinc transporter ZIP3-like [Uloborus diversus]